MFAQLNPATASRQRRLLTGSVACHALLLLWLLHPPDPQRLTAVSIASGKNGTSVTRLYWPSRNPDSSSQSSADSATQRYRHQRLSHNKLTLDAPVQLAKAASPINPLARTNAEDDAKTQTLSAVGHGAQAGSPNGSLNYDRFYGPDVRPALPVKTSDPVIYPWELPNYEGNEVIEVVIDERGEIVRKTVLASLGPEIDAKCLAALENWHFQPATKNGAPIPSKQDTIFAIKARG
jgi:outer membrane biosynthesis protein TonB